MSTHHRRHVDPLADTGRYQAMREEAAKHVSAISSSKERLRRAWREEQREKSLPKRILIVDDHDLVRRSLATMLEKKTDLDVRVCATAQEALAELSAHEYDLLVCDVDLPDLDGEQLVYEVRCGGKRPQLPVLLVSGFEVEPDLKRIAERVGAAGYFSKGSSMAERLAYRVKEILER